jgi:hypothetical protein
LSASDDQQLYNELRLLAGHDPVTPGGFGGPEPQIFVRRTIAINKDFWLTWPPNEWLLAGFALIVVFVLARRVEWYWTIIYQAGVWMLALAREKRS